MKLEKVQHFFAKQSLDLGFARFNASLLLLLVLAFGLVAVKDWNRRLLRDYQQLSYHLDQAKIRWETLLLEKNALLSEASLEERQSRQGSLHFPSIKERLVFHKQDGEQ